MTDGPLKNPSGGSRLHGKRVRYCDRCGQSQVTNPDTAPKVCGCGCGIFTETRRVPWRPFENLHPGDQQLLRRFRISAGGP